MTISEIVKLYNDKNNNTDKEIVSCKFCETHSMWGGYEDDPTMWSCEECGSVFCDNCCEVDNENDERILCGDCKIKQLTLREAKEKFRKFQMSTLFMDIESMIDCSGVTFDEWVEQNSIIIKS